MTLRSKVVLILVSVFIIYGAVDFSIQRFVVFPGFKALENEHALKNSKRIVQAIEREMHHLNLLCFDWAAWDDTYDFVESFSKEYIDANLVTNTFMGNSLNLISIYNTKGKISDGLIEVSGTIEETANGVNMAHIIIKDNGQGLATEDFERIFERDFSKKDRLSGFGLHWCANVISSVNGEVYAKKNGSGQGLSFHLLIPINS